MPSAEPSVQGGVFKKAHPVYALFLIGAEDIFEPAERDRFEFRVAAAVVAFRGDSAPPFCAGIVEIHAVERVERGLHIRRVDRTDAEPAGGGAVLGGGAVAENLMHRFNRRDVEQRHLAVFQKIAVAAVDRRLDFGGGNIGAECVERAFDVERSVRGVFDGHHRNYRRHGVDKLFKPFGKLRKPTFAAQSGDARAEECQDFLGVGQVKFKIAFPVSGRKAPFADGFHGVFLRRHRPDSPHEIVVGIGEIDGPVALDGTGRKI